MNLLDGLRPDKLLGIETKPPSDFRAPSASLPKFEHVDHRAASGNDSGREGAAKGSVLKRPSLLNVTFQIRRITGL